MEGIHITGASGSGVTTLGGALAVRLGRVHLDTDSFYWLPSDPPFRDRRPLIERMEMIERAFAGADRSWVLSGSLDGWGDPFIPRFGLVVFIYTPPEARMMRLLARERERYGAAIEPGGVMYAQHREFAAWAEGYDGGARPGRSLPRHEAWLASLTCPVLRLDGLQPINALVQTVIAAVPASSNPAR